MRILSSVCSPAPLGIAALAVVLLGSSPAGATTITFTASTTGCFTTDTCLSTDFGSPEQVDNLKFVGTSTTGSIDSDAPTAINPFILGSFQVPDPLANINTTPVDEFHLKVTFTAPPNVLPGFNIYEALLVGKITGGDTNNTLTIDFNNDPVAFSFSDAFGSGAFTLEVLNDPTFVGQPNSTGLGKTIINPSINIDGRIVLTSYTPNNGQGGGVSAVPEPASLLLFGTGLLGLGRTRYRARR